MNKNYLVSYFHWIDGKSSGFGNIVIGEAENEDIYTVKEINEIEKTIIAKNKFSGCSILNIIPLND